MTAIAILRIVDSWNSSDSTLEVREQGEILDGHCETLGRDSRTIPRSCYGWALKTAARGLPDRWESASAFEDVVRRYHESGVEAFIIDQPRPEQFATMGTTAAHVIPRMRRDGV